MKTFVNLSYMQGGRCTRRYHNVTMREHQRVDAHSYGVTQIARFIMPEDLEPDLKVRVLEACLDHDLPEQHTGDLPAPFKRGLTQACRAELAMMERDSLEAGMLYAEPLPEELLRYVKIADAADGCLHCIEERRMGNTFIGEVFHKFYSYLEDLNFREVSEDLYRYIVENWTSANGAWRD